MKKWLLALLLSIPLVAAQGQVLSNVWEKILYFAGLGFLNIGPDIWIIAFTRLLIWTLIFTLFFAVMTQKGEKKVLGFLTRGQAGVVAACIATIAAIFLPADLILATGAGWATLVAFVLIGAPIVGIAFLLWKIPWEGEETKATVFLKLMLCLALLWILTAMKYHIGRIG